MPAQTQCRLNAADFEIALAMVRTGMLAMTDEWLGVDASMVFRSLQRIERGLGTTLSARSCMGYSAGDLAHALAEQAEQVESVLEAARPAVYTVPDQVSGTVRIITTDTVLVGLVAPALKALQAQHPHLRYDLRVSNELASLARRDADVIVRATHRPPQHLASKCIGSIRVRLYAGRVDGITYADVEAGRTPWAAIDDAIPDRPSVGWRKRHFPKVMPTYSVNSLLIAAEMVGMGVGAGILPLLMAQERRDLVPLQDLQDANQLELWLLTHPESHRLRRIVVMYGHLAQTLWLPQISQQQRSVRRRARQE